jgi:hypothetical protein
MYSTKSDASVRNYTSHATAAEQAEAGMACSSAHPNDKGRDIAVPALTFVPDHRCVASSHGRAKLSSD